MASLTVYFVVFTLAVSVASGLTCYKCDSSESGLCNYGLTSFTYNTVDCQNENGGSTLDILSSWVPKQCVKLVAKGKDGSEYVARGCVPSIGPLCQGIVKTFGFFSNVEGGIEDVNCYTCDGDKCNSAAKFTGFTFIAIILAAVTYCF